MEVKSDHHIKVKLSEHTKDTQFNSEELLIPIPEHIENGNTFVLNGSEWDSVVECVKTALSKLKLEGHP